MWPVWSTGQTSLVTQASVCGHMLVRNLISHAISLSDRGLPLARVLCAARLAHPQLTVNGGRTVRGQLTLEHLVRRGCRQVGGDADIPGPRLRRQIGLLREECLEALGREARPVVQHDCGHDLVTDVL